MIETTEPWGGALHKRDTSHLAKLSIASHVSRLEQVVIEHIQVFGPSTCDEMEVRLEMSHQCLSARVSQLRDRGRLYDSGDRRKTRSGRQAAVWALR